MAGGLAQVLRAPTYQMQSPKFKPQDHKKTEQKYQKNK
jgi:hypothetical protein